MGPELGEFIAGIRNEDNQQCVTDETRWLYASRASVWKSDDRSLTVKCHEPEGEIRIIILTDFYSDISCLNCRRHRHSRFRSEEEDDGAAKDESENDHHHEEAEQDDHIAAEKQ